MSACRMTPLRTATRKLLVVSSRRRNFSVAAPSPAALLQDLQRAAAWNHGKEGSKHDRSLWEPEFCRRVVQHYDVFLSDVVAGVQPQDHSLLSAETVSLAIKALTKAHLDTAELSLRVRVWERALGQIKQTPLTDHLSLRLLTANGKAGNVGRVLSLLQLRKTREFPPRPREFLHAVTALQAAAVPRQRNIFRSDTEQPAIDNPTRWLDAILINMHQRNVPLQTFLANRMLLCYAAGYTGKAAHHFYRVTRQPVTALPIEDRHTDTESMPHDYFANHGGYQPVKVRLDYHHTPPPFYKKPSLVKGKLLFGPNDTEGAFKFDKEKDPEYSLPLAAAFAFADSLQHGACGHDGITLNTGSYNALIKACVQRGALWRAMHVLEDIMPDASHTQPNNISYNLLLAGLARVGDVVTIQEYYQKMQVAGLKPDAFTVQYVVDGLLNLGDAPAAVTVVQDFFNQHSILPPYTTHIKILEFCLARDMIYEAKRYLYFIQQLWHWQPNEKYHDPAFIQLMRATQRNTQLQQPALQQLFQYFGETLHDTDFL